MSRLAPLLALAAVAFAAPATASAQNPQLIGTVGPGFTISLTLADGQPATQLSGGTYDVVVTDRSAMHNFHLSGPGVNKKTSLAFRGTVTWRLKLRKGTYRFVCDPHAGGMKGTLRIR